MSLVDTTAAARATRRAARRPRVQHLITADEHSLAELEAVLATLPLCAVGRVFIEVPDVESVSTVVAPPRMTVTWLPRSRRTGGVGSTARCVPGQALTRAAGAWADEMICADAAGLRTEAILLGGYLGTADIIDHLVEDLGLSADAIDAPARYGLLAR